MDARREGKRDKQNEEKQNPEIHGKHSQPT